MPGQLCLTAAQGRGRVKGQTSCVSVFVMHAFFKHGFPCLHWLFFIFCFVQGLNKRYRSRCVWVLCTTGKPNLQVCMWGCDEQCRQFKLLSDVRGERGGCMFLCKLKCCELPKRYLTERAEWTDCHFLASIIMSCNAVVEGCSFLRASLSRKAVSFRFPCLYYHPSCTWKPSCNDYIRFWRC